MGGSLTGFMLGNMGSCTYLHTRAEQGVCLRPGPAFLTQIGMGATDGTKQVKIWQLLYMRGRPKNAIIFITSTPEKVLRILGSHHFGFEAQPGCVLQHDEQRSCVFVDISPKIKE